MAYLNGNKILFSPEVIVGASKIKPITITKNGTYNPSDENVDGYSPVEVNVPSPRLLDEKEITANGTYIATVDQYDAYKKVTVDVKPNLQKKIVDKVGTVTADDGYDGLSSVVIDISVPLLQEEREITKNGTYKAREEGIYDAYKKVVVDVKPNLQEKLVTKNGDVTADENFDGLSRVTIAVPEKKIYEGIKTITQNGLYWAGTDGYDGYASVGVQVEGAISVLDKTITELRSDTLTKIDMYVCYNCTELTTADFPNCTTLGAAAFQGCTKLVNINFPKVTTLGNSVFHSTGIKEANMPLATTIGQTTFYQCKSLVTVDTPQLTKVGQNAFSGCSVLTEINVPLLATIDATAFQNCTALTKISLPSATNIGLNAFSGCTKLDTLILGQESCTLMGVGVLTNTKIAKGEGFIYVPDEYVATYKEATNWSSFANQIKPISELPTEQEE